MGEEEGGQGASSGMGGIWGSLIGGIFNSVGKSQDLQIQKNQFGNASFFKAGAFNNKNNDLIIFIVLLVAVIVVIVVFKIL